jgi:hypothetical protein
VAGSRAGGPEVWLPGGRAMKHGMGVRVVHRARFLLPRCITPTPIRCLIPPLLHGEGLFMDVLQRCTLVQHKYATCTPPLSMGAVVSCLRICRLPTMHVVGHAGP